MRLSSKGFLMDPDGRLLLLDSTDPADPATCWWELPGGGVEAGESEVDALVREVLEETGLALRPEAVGPLLWTQESTFTWLGSGGTCAATGASSGSLLPRLLAGQRVDEPFDTWS